MRQMEQDMTEQEDIPESSAARQRSRFQQHPQRGEPPPDRSFTSHHRTSDDEDGYRRHHAPKLVFPRFTGACPTVWLDKCEKYFQINKIKESMWVISASVCMDENAAMWWQVYKMKQGIVSWPMFKQAVIAKFGAYDYQRAMDDLLDLQQIGTVEEYVAAFESLQFKISMHDSGMSDTYFISQFIKGLKPEIRYSVQGQAPHTMEKATMLARIQQTIQDKVKQKNQKPYSNLRSSSSAFVKPEAKGLGFTSMLGKERQARDYCRANNLCFYCKEPYDATHAAKCTKRPQLQQPHVNALVVNDLDTNLTDEILNQLAIEDTLAEEFCTLSLNALAGTEEGEAMRLRSLVKNKVLLMLVDSGSSHSFASSTFLQKVGITPVPTSARTVKLANGETLVTDSYVPAMEWWNQGYTFTSDMKVLDLTAYDAILGYDWLKLHSPINHHWENKTMQFLHKGDLITLTGIQPASLSLTALSSDQLVKCSAGNDIWAFAVVEQTQQAQESAIPSEIQQVLQDFQDVFEEPKSLPPSRGQRMKACMHLIFC